MSAELPVCPGACVVVVLLEGESCPGVELSELVGADVLGLLVPDVEVLFATVVGVAVVA